MYVLTSNGEKILREKYRFNIRSARFEYKMINEICDFLSILNIKYEKQYQILNYRIDLYISEFNIAVEYDEKEHKYKKDNDCKRQKTIEQFTKCKFIRIKEGESIGIALAKIIKQIINEGKLMKEKLFNDFISNYNQNNWHPCDIKRLNEYIKYYYENHIDEEEMIEPIISSNLLNDNNKNKLIKNSIAVYEYLLLK